jgi:hypothetical protein
LVRKWRQENRPIRWTSPSPTPGESSAPMESSRTGRSTSGRHCHLASSPAVGPDAVQSSMPRFQTPRWKRWDYTVCTTFTTWQGRERAVTQRPASISFSSTVDALLARPTHAQSRLPDSLGGMRAEPPFRMRHLSSQGATLAHGIYSRVATFG